jgi:hypothetical protein
LIDPTAKHEGRGSCRCRPTTSARWSKRTPLRGRPSASIDGLGLQLPHGARYSPFPRRRVFQRLPRTTPRFDSIPAACRERSSLGDPVPQVARPLLPARIMGLPAPQPQRDRQNIRVPALHRTQPRRLATLDGARARPPFASAPGTQRPGSAENNTAHVRAS